MAQVNFKHNDVRAVVGWFMPTGAMMEVGNISAIILICYHN